MKKNIVFVIVSFHPKMEKFSVLLTLLKDFPTIIVDNGGTLTLDQVGRATLLTQLKNIGYAAAANIGIHHASGLGAEWFVILNQDVHFTGEALRSLVRELRRLPPSVAGPFSAGLDRSRWTSVLPSSRTDYLTGSCLALHEKVVGKVGYFYEPYFLYYEDADYCVRVKNAGFPLVTLPSDGVSHEESASLGKGSEQHQYYLARNHLLFVRRLAPVSVVLRERIRLPYTIIQHIVRREWGALRGVRDYVLRRFGAYEHRN